jgi:glycine/D-amino acid oxidase-like deaminating enzyme
MTGASTNPAHFQRTSGTTEPVWIHLEPYRNRPTFPKLDKDVETDVCIIGAGIAGISTAYELVTRGHNVVLLEARDVLSGETGRTSGHLANALDDGYTNIAAKHGQKGAKAAADSHTWALQRVGEISKELQIDCEYRMLPGYEVSQWPRGDKRHDEDARELRAEVLQSNH